MDEAPEHKGSSLYLMIVLSMNHLTRLIHAISEYRVPEILDRASYQSTKIEFCLLIHCCFVQKKGGGVGLSQRDIEREKTMKG